MPDILFSEFVEPELSEIWATIAADHPDAAERFLVSAYETFALLAERPHIGRPRMFPSPRLRDMRSFRIEGFIPIAPSFRTLTTDFTDEHGSHKSVYICVIRG